MWNYIDVFKGNSMDEELLKFIPNGQEDVWKCDDQIRNLGPVCISCAKGDCRTIEVIFLDGDMVDLKKMLENRYDGIYFHKIEGRYQKVTSLYNGKCQWERLGENRPIFKKVILYDNFKNVWVIRIGEGDCIRTVQDVPCPTFANTFEYHELDSKRCFSRWKPAPINSIIIRHVK